LYDEDRPHGAIGNKPPILLQNPAEHPAHRRDRRPEPSNLRLSSKWSRITEALAQSGQVLRAQITTSGAQAHGLNYLITIKRLPFSTLYTQKAEAPFISSHGYHTTRAPDPDTYAARRVPWSKKSGELPRMASTDLLEALFQKRLNLNR
jgi:hypothetical protein